MKQKKRKPDTLRSHFFNLSVIGALIAPDTLRFAPDTLKFAPDTLRFAPDTLTFAPDTLR